MADPLKDREIFAIGNWKASTGTVNVDAAFIEKMIASYQNLNSKVTGFGIPIKLGHNNRVGEPAYGWVTNVRATDAGTVLADFEGVDPAIVDSIAKKRYNAVSIELLSKLEYGGTTHENVLSGLALLGAEWPAVKGLKPVSSFADGGETVQFTRQEPTVQFTQEQVDAMVLAAKVEIESKLTAATERATRAEAALANFTDLAEKAEIDAVIDLAETEGKIVPANKASVTALAETIRKSISADARKGALEQFKAFVGAMSKKVDFTETMSSEQARAGDQSLPGMKVDAAAKAKMAKDGKLTYRDALDLVFAEQPDLKTAYAEENR